MSDNAGVSFRKKIPIGSRFSRWTVVGDSIRMADGRFRYLCKCECGMERRVSGDNLKRGDTQSCGCLIADTTGLRATKHSQSRSPTYSVWVAMRQRCENPSQPKYHRYGGRGITVCERWRTFENFLADMGPAPRGLELDRINNDGGYSLENCRWTTRKQNMRNRAATRYVEINGERKCVAEWVEIFGVSRRSVYYQMSRGVPIAAALQGVRA